MHHWHHARDTCAPSSEIATTMNTRVWALRRVRRPLQIQTSPWTHTRHYSASPEAERAPQRRESTAVSYHTRPKVSTLNPSLITPTDYIDISRKTGFSVEFPVSKSFEILYSSHSPPGLKFVNIRFPDYSRGFLYYHCDSGAGPLEGSIRFRLTPDNLPSSFLSGQDLLAPSGFPWQILLAQVACRDKYAFIGEQLVHENLVTREQLSRCRDVFGQRDLIYPQYTLFRLDSPFLVNFSSPVHFTVVGEPRPVDLSSLFKNQTLGERPYFPWTGSGIARFERSTLTKYAGRRVIHLRIDKILQPVTCTVNARSYRGRVVRPEEGQLFTVRFRGGPPEPWGYDIDKKFEFAAALRVLWDNSRLP
ncbi:hypothetical protein B0H17DRAFT_451136 [Mycena rosella]|uniref:Uncharacterized protein n=1 Tax=Mycena rosella TaxID=1033263 RepID=A0AAD7GYT4_MYCRO|nr:hypothetical protein B0H17DRAFT_451136 [Mycena rosella]